MSEEAEKIVAWLRREAERYRSKACNTDLRTGMDYRMADHFNRKADWYTEAANAIEAGAHLKRPEPTIPAEEWIKQPSVGH